MSDPNALTFHWTYVLQTSKTAVYTRYYSHSDRALFVTYRGSVPIAFGYTLEGADFFHIPSVEYLERLLRNETQHDIKSFSAKCLTAV